MSSEFTPSQAEVALTAKIFEKADTSQLGILTGDVAVAVFSGSKLSATVLGEVWAIADKENNGFLTKKGVAIALRLMGHAQRGEQVTEALLTKPGLPPTIEVSPVLQQVTGGSADRSKSPTIALPQLTPQDKAKFMKIFLSCNPTNGIVSGDKAGEVFVKSKLSVDKLSQIWTLADTQKRGSLDAADFCVAMYLIQACMSGQLSFVPTTLPPGLYDQAAGKSLDTILTNSTGGSSGLSPVAVGSFNPSAIRPQHTGNQLLQPQTTGQASRVMPSPPALPSRRANNAFSQSQQTSQWDISATEKASADRFFEQLDTSKKGYVEGEVVVPFMLQSKLGEDVLAQVWDLADLNNDGRLTRDGFAVAMHLIQKKLAGQEIPATLPPSLVPPSMRGNVNIPVVPPAQESIQDLIWDDPPPISPTAPAPQTLQPQKSGPLPPTASQILQPQRTGQLSSHATGQSVSVASPPPPTFSPLQHQDPFGTAQFSAARDLLGDDEEVAKPAPFQDRSAEIGNVQNQLNSTNRAVETVKNDREDIEKRVADQAAQLSTLQTQLTSAKTAYETEVKLLETLRERYATQNVEIDKARQDLITAESDVSALKLERNEVQGTLLRDKEEVRELQRKMASAGAEIETLKAENEKVKKDAKQQKGLLAIAKKQLVTRETEKAKVEKELEEARAELGDVTKEREEAEADLAKEVPSNLTNGHEFTTSSSPDSLSFAVAQPLPASPDAVSSSSTSIKSPPSKSTNPFDRLTGSSTPRSESPFRPLATSSDVPTSAGVDTTSPTEDPFGPASADTEEHQPTSAIESTLSNTEEISASTPKPGSPESARLNTDIINDAPPGLDGEDLFSTPPHSAVGPVSADVSGGRTSTLDTLDAAVAQFPDISSPHPPGHFPDAVATDETDLSSELKELEANESDSSDDETKEVENPKAPEASTSASNAFDDTFGFSSKPAPSQDPDKTPIVPFELSSPVNLVPSSIESAFKPNGITAEATAGKNAFDEAMGTIPVSPANPSSGASFGFDSAFDDNFDFAAAKAESTKPFFPPPRSNNANGSMFPGSHASPRKDAFDSAFGLQNNNSGASPPPVQRKSISFDDAFGTGLPGTHSNSHVSSEAPSISFEDAFGGQRLSKALAFDDAFAVPNEPPSQQQSALTFPGPSPPQSPMISAPSSVAMSPPSQKRSASMSPSLDPVQRNSSIKARSSTISSEKSKEPSQRHSRLTIRLPFGKKKKQDSAPPPPRSSYLSPPAENENSDDDIDTVKQLTSMGFTRDQAVEALERNSYDFQRALNNLLDVQ